MTVKKAYQTELVARGYTADPAQLRAVDALDACAREWARFKEKRSNPLKKLSGILSDRLKNTSLKPPRCARFCLLLPRTIPI